MLVAARDRVDGVRDAEDDVLGAVERLVDADEAVGELEHVVA